MHRVRLRTQQMSSACGRTLSLAHGVALVRKRTLSLTRGAALVRKRTLCNRAVIETRFAEVNGIRLHYARAGEGLVRKRTLCNRAVIETRFAQVNGIRLHYARAGEGPLILFLHGFPEFWMAWQAQLEEFGKTHLAVAPDLRGFNLSDKPPEVADYRAKHIVGDIGELAEHLGAARFTLVAHDWGGAAGWAFAMAFPNYVEKLVIINSPHPATFARELRHNPAQRKASEYMNWLRAPGAEDALARDGCKLMFEFMARGHAGPWLTGATRDAYLAAWQQPGALRGGCNYYRASPIHPPVAGDESGLRAVLADTARFRVDVPTLVIWGERDVALLTALLDGLDEYVPNLTIRRIPEGSHWVAHEYPEQVNAMIREFIA